MMTTTGVLHDVNGKKLASVVFISADDIEEAGFDVSKLSVSQMDEVVRLLAGFIERDFELENALKLACSEAGLKKKGLVDVGFINQILVENGFTVDVDGSTIKLGKGFSIEVDSQGVLLIDRGLIRENFKLPERKMTRSWINQFIDVVKVHTGM